MPVRRGADRLHEAGQGLVVVLLGGDSGERRLVLESLILQGDDAAADVVGTALLQSHWPVCGELTEALAQFGGEAAKAQLLRALKARRHHVRSAAVKALAALGGDDVYEALRSLANDPSYEVRQDAGEALERPRCQEQPDAR